MPRQPDGDGLHGRLTQGGGERLLQFQYQRIFFGKDAVSGGLFNQKPGCVPAQRNPEGAVVALIKKLRIYQPVILQPRNIDIAVVGGKGDIRFPLLRHGKAGVMERDVVMKNDGGQGLV